PLQRWEGRSCRPLLGRLGLRARGARGGTLYRLDPDLTVTKWESGLTCPNGIGWSPDNRTMYFTDSMVRTVWAYEYDFATGGLGERRVFARLDPSDGVPDGLTVDREGYVWSAVWDGWR